MGSLRIGIIILAMILLIIVVYFISMVYLTIKKKWYIGCMLTLVPLLLTFVTAALAQPSERPRMGDGFIPFAFLVLVVIGWIIIVSIQGIKGIIHVIKKMKR